ncbi:MAG TPA: 2-oxoglutarate dehydrogenase complex dihydrolipoyllysine-residue succinyltransferase [Armatimonadaceae bacterium]|nr:2-oxoglutarate dehydrogenase complex dihydrolipoyllysine-residue succinyltransferase [Armatimonadaceae bacterium]
MPIDIVVPAMGESVVEATIAQWLKSPGDRVEAGEDLVELETDKVNQSIQAEASGVLSEIRRQTGDTVAVGEVLAVLDEKSDGAAAAAPAAAAQAAPAPAPAAEEAAPSTAAAAQPATANGREAAAGPGAAAVHATPLAQRVAAESGVDLGTVTGSGVGGRIFAGDVTAKAQPAEAASAPAAPTVSAPTPSPAARTAGATTGGGPAATTGRPEERIRITRRRATIAANLVMAQQTAAMLTTFNEVDMSAVMELRKRRKEAFEKQFGVGLGFMSFFSKAVIGALKQFPYLNASIEGDEIVLKKYYDIGIAVGVEDGLVVPIVRDADKKSFAEIEKTIKELAEKARDGKLSLPDLQGGTFTITNGGVYGSLMSTPILNYPQVGILGMHTIQERPVARGGEVVIRPMMYIALSYDHRIVDGSTAVRFLVKVKQLVEDPETLLLEG